MTRETKIGLLVGLAFIIVIGILLSDYNRNEIQNAPLPQIADNMRSSTATLHNGSNQNEIIPPPAAPVPTRTVLTPQELHHETIVNIGPGPSTLSAHNNSEEHIPVTPISPLKTNTPERETVAEGHTPAPVEPAGPTGIEGTIPVGPRTPTPRDTPTPTPAPTVNGARQYVAVEGDTLSKLAGRFMGGNTKTNRELIVAINPSLKANPNNVIVGKTYMIPGPKTVVAAAGTTPPVRPAPVVAAVTPTDGPHYFYTVKDNDNLWKIASEQLGDGNALAAIKELNKDILKGGDVLHPKMRLRLPAKPIASTN